MTTAGDEAFWREMERMPDLQALVERAGRRYAASVGEEYIEDPSRRMKEAPHQGGYQHITPEEWARWDRANEVFQARRRERVHDAHDASSLYTRLENISAKNRYAGNSQERHMRHAGRTGCNEKPPPRLPTLLRKNLTRKNQHQVAISWRKLARPTPL
jgi:hypothetical protein